MSDDSVEVEGTGETVGEAKWMALRELERRIPGLDKGSVEFQVVSEGERGLLGVGFTPARVLARAGGAAVPAPPPLPPTATPAAPPEGASAAAALAHDLLERIRAGLGLEATVRVTEGPGGVHASFQGRDVGLVIGKHGQTIDAIQYLVSAAVSRVTEARVDVLVDAAGYRDRRRATLEGIADRGAARALASGAPVELDPMPAPERKLVHLYLKDREGVVTASAGNEPNRYVVVAPSP